MPRVGAAGLHGRPPPVRFRGRANADAEGWTMSASKLPAPTLERLKAAAREASEQAYCPYSRFRVGAAILSEKGDIFSGCNVENASYGLTICAERNAAFQMVAAGQTKIRAVAIYTPTSTPTVPCGACRQVLNEFGPTAEVLSFCDGSGTLRQSLAELLPAAFGPGNLE
jgi:cytidine deaminase